MILIYFLGNKIAVTNIPNRAHDANGEQSDSIQIKFYIKKSTRRSKYYWFILCSSLAEFNLSLCSPLAINRTTILPFIYLVWWHEQHIYLQNVTDLLPLTVSTVFLLHLCKMHAQFRYAVTGHPLCSVETHLKRTIFFPCHSSNGDVFQHSFVF